MVSRFSVQPQWYGLRHPSSINQNDVSICITRFTSFTIVFVLCCWGAHGVMLALWICMYVQRCYMLMCSVTTCIALIHPRNAYRHYISQLKVNIIFYLRKTFFTWIIAIVFEYLNNQLLFLMFLITHSNHIICESPTPL